MSATLEQQVRELALQAKAASRELARASTQTKNAVLKHVATALRGAAQSEILRANQVDMKEGKVAGLNEAMLDRLLLNEKRMAEMATGVEQVIALTDPIGSITEERGLANGLHVSKMRIPLGLIAIIYESRPNVTIDAAALCVKSGNAVLLRGGKEAFHSNQALAKLFEDALSANGLSKAGVLLLPTTDRAATLAMIALEDVVDLAIPRGGEGLIRFVAQNARVPVIKHYKGLCHLYVDGDANLDKALSLAINGKTQRPGVCNAIETVLVDRAVAKKFLPSFEKEMQERKVEIRADEEAIAILKSAKPAQAQDWDTEYLDLIVNVGVVSGLDGALQHVARHGTNHSEVIVTENPQRAERFLREVDASFVAANASSRFNDGFQLGLGAEIGISTTKMHAYGPMGLNELCALKWVVRGNGQTRN